MAQVTKNVKSKQTVTVCDRCGKHDAPGGALIVSRYGFGPTGKPFDIEGDLCANCAKIVASKFKRATRQKKAKNG